MANSFWVVLGGTAPVVKRSEAFVAEENVFDETNLHFYGSLSVDGTVVGFDIHSRIEELSPINAIPNVIYFGESVYPAFLLIEVTPRSRIVENGEELFGDLSLHRSRDGQFAFLFHDIDDTHPLFPLFDRLS